MNNTKGDILVMLGLSDSKVKAIPEELVCAVDRYDELMNQFGRRTGISSEGLALLIYTVELKTGKNMTETAKQMAQQKEETSQEEKAAEAVDLFTTDMKIDKLKKECEERGLKTYGTKEDLVNRLNEATNKQEAAAA